MSMFPEVAAESVIRVLAEEIKRELRLNQNRPEVCEALRRVGRSVLMQGGRSEWAREYWQLFGETTPTSPSSVRVAHRAMHHDDPPCTARLENGFCPRCEFVPDMQSTCLNYSCPNCRVQLDSKMTCPTCRETFNRE